MMNQTDYLNLITSQHRLKAKFTAMVSLSVNAEIYFQNLLGQMISAFDIDTAQGSFLDIIGQWIGLTRNISVPITGVFFSWDTDAVGWDLGTWQPSLAPTNVTSLPDDAYRTLLKARIAANAWDGTTEGAYRIWSQIFSTLQIVIQDNGDMTYNFGIIGGAVDALTLALITGGYVQLKPQTIRIKEYFFAADANPLFAWDQSTLSLGGWDTSSWVREAAPT